MHVFEVRDRLIADYSSYVRSFIHIHDPRISEKVDQELRQGLSEHLNKETARSADVLSEAHRCLGAAARIRGMSCRVGPKRAPDAVGIYVSLPAQEGSHV